MLPDFKQQFKQLLRTNSVSSTQANLDQSNKEVIDLLASWLDELGFKLEIQAVAEGKYNLLAQYGSGTGGFVLAGHTDTVPYDETHWASNPLDLYEADNRWYGLGSCDMKGFFAIAIKALQPLLNKPFKQPLFILATCDEESSMNGARTLLASKQKFGRAAVIGEPTNLHPIRLHKGIMMDRIEMIGQSGHSSNPTLGHSALEAMNEAMTTLLKLRSKWQQHYQNPLFSVPYPTLNLGCIHGGDNPNRICGQCALEFDLRPLPTMVADDLRATIIQQLTPIIEKHQVSLNYQPLFGDIPAFEQNANSELVKLAEKLTGLTSESVAFATEAPFIQQVVGDTIILGAGSIDQAHQPNEYLSLSQIEPYTLLLRQLITHYCLS
ncbi:acetylornithine deacetylase [Entomomonas moraniae]|uniref:Acetylornithine deacetylase n=1 Tax=Entomomonas moraniae TaxID=2213226 RepID=A0A3Q9JMC5_9GAMM|nr:acetylornithine deacetylase [Entomomonas moraniae]AZS51555.1 acetylornithine deacetylase [Entomomonas moraniae]